MCPGTSTNQLERVVDVLWKLNIKKNTLVKILYFWLQAHLLFTNMLNFVMRSGDLYMHPHIVICTCTCLRRGRCAVCFSLRLGHPNERFMRNGDNTACYLVPRNLWRSSSALENLRNEQEQHGEPDQWVSLWLFKRTISGFLRMVERGIRYKTQLASRNCVN